MTLGERREIGAAQDLAADSVRALLPLFATVEGGRESLELRASLGLGLVAPLPKLRLVGRRRSSPSALDETSTYER